MKFDDPDHTNTALSLYVSDFGRLTTHPVIVPSLVKWGKMSAEQARGYLTPGHLPLIKVVKDDVFKPATAFNNFPTTVDFSETMVSNYVKSMGKSGQAQFVTSSGHTVARIGVTMLHAIIIGHLRVYSFDNDDRDRAHADVRAEMFDREVYGDITIPAGSTW